MVKNAMEGEVNWNKKNHHLQLSSLICSQRSLTAASYHGCGLGSDSPTTPCQHFQLKIDMVST